MPILILLGIFTVYFILDLCDFFTKPTPPIKDKQALLRDFCGKSESECRKILKRYKF